MSRIKTAQRLDKVPPYAFAQLDQAKKRAIERGIDIINLGVGDPDLPTPEWVWREAQAAVGEPRNHRYPDYEGSFEFREAVAGYYQRRFGVSLDPKTDVMALIGSKEGLAHMVWGMVDPGDVVLIPDPAYPVYEAHTHYAGGEPYFMPLEAHVNFLPDFGAIPHDIAQRAKVMFLNYPNNPTGAVAGREFFEAATGYCREHDILLCHDAAYIEMTYDGYRAPSVLEVPGAREVAVEFYSLSKPFNMTGWRIAAAVGNTDALAALGRVKTNTDSGQSGAIQQAGIVALREDPGGFIGHMNEVYRRRRDVLVEGLKASGWDVQKPQGTFYLWARCPGGMDGNTMAALLLEEAGIIVAPGPAWGAQGQRYVRFALTVPEERLAEACQRISSIMPKLCQ